MEAATQHRNERRAGLLLIAAAGTALLLANGPWQNAYHHLLDFRVGPPLPRHGMLSVHQWIADGLMAIFFLLVGLEVKREWYLGRLASPAERRLPIIAAVAGMLVPALVYLAVTAGDPALVRGWAIPAATDIAFAIGVLALLGGRAPPAVKLLLVTIAIVDDIGAVAIIALAYTAALDWLAIAIAGAILAAMMTMNRLGVRRLAPYLIAAALLWLAVAASGVHATIAGVLAALAIPIERGEQSASPLHRLEHAIHPWVMLGIMPLFGLASAGVHFPASAAALVAPLPLAILLGLLVGKQVGVFSALWLAVKAGLAPKPAGASWPHLYGAALLCGVGFTMSLFIGALAFADPALVDQARLGTLAGSLLSAVGGYTVLRLAAPRPATRDDEDDAADLFADD